MPTDRSTWPPAARALAEAVQAAAEACGAGDRDALEAAVASLGRGERGPLAVVLGTATLELIERAHPDGLDAESAELLLDGAVQAARPWLPDVDDDLVLRALTAATGVADLPGAAIVDPTRLLVHALVLFEHLVRRTGVPTREAVDSAMAELIRAQTVELP